MINLRGIVRIILAGSATLTVATGLTACTSGAEPLTTFTPTPTASEPSVEPSPTPTMTEEERLLALIPEDAKGDDLYAAEAMAKFVVSLHPKLFQGDSSALFEYVCVQTSAFCESSVTTSRSRTEAGFLQEGGGVSFSDQLSELVLDVESGLAYVSFVFTETAGQVRGPDGDIDRVIQPNDIRFTAELALIDGVWRVTGADFDAA